MNITLFDYNRTGQAPMMTDRYGHEMRIDSQDVLLVVRQDHDKLLEEVVALRQRVADLEGSN